VSAQNGLRHTGLCALTLITDGVYANGAILGPTAAPAALTVAEEFITAATEEHCSTTLDA